MIAAAKRWIVGEDEQARNEIKMALNQEKKKWQQENRGVEPTSASQGEGVGAAEAGTRASAGPSAALEHAEATKPAKTQRKCTAAKTASAPAKPTPTTIADSRATVATESKAAQPTVAISKPVKATPAQPTDGIPPLDAIPDF